MGSVAGKQTNNLQSSYYQRRAHHAGSWYDEDGDELRATLESFLLESSSSSSESSATSTSSSSTPLPQSDRRLRALIVPHAGYSYSGTTAAYAYQALRQELMLADSNRSPIRTILVLHPSHHVYLPDQCAVSHATTLETPLGDLQVDDELRREILGLKNSQQQPQQQASFTFMTASQDEREHSGEMQYPYLAHCLQQQQPQSSSSRLLIRDDIKCLPVMCGSLSTEAERAFGALLRDIIHRPHVLTVISTDFCHWGRRFDYQPTPTSLPTFLVDGSKKKMPIHEFIQQLDRRGMDLIAAQQPGAFAAYLKETRNTICGRHAVAVWLRAVADDDSNNNSGDADLTIDFVQYAQSSPSKTMLDSSVSYAAAVVTAATATTAAAQSK